MACIAICTSRKRYSPSTLNCSVAHPVPTQHQPWPCPLGIWSAAGWGHSHHACLEGRRCTSVLNTFPFLDHWKVPQELEQHPELQMGNVLSNPDTLCKSWDDWLRFGHLSCPSSPCRSISLHCRRTRGTQKGRDFLAKAAESKSWCYFLQKTDRLAQKQVKAVESMCIFLFLAPLISKPSSQNGPADAFLICRSFLQR